MPRFRRYPKRRSKKTLTKKNIYRKTNAKSQAHQIALLDKRLTRLSKDSIHRGFYKYSLHTDSGSPYHAIQPIGPSGWTKIFNSQASNETQQSCYVRKIHCQTLLQTVDQDSSTPLTGTLFVVSLKTKTSQQVMVETSGMANLVVNEHYTNVATSSAIPGTSGSALIYMNKDLFNIHVCKRFMLSDSPFYQSTYPADSVGVTNIRDANKRIKWTLDYKKRLKTDNTGQQDDGWKTLNGTDIPPQHLIFQIIFTNPPTGSTTNLAVSSNFLFDVQTIE